MGLETEVLAKCLQQEWLDLQRCTRLPYTPILTEARKLTP